MFKKYLILVFMAFFLVAGTSQLFSNTLRQNDDDGCVRFCMDNMDDPDTSENERREQCEIECFGGPPIN